MKGPQAYWPFGGDIRCEVKQDIVPLIMEARHMIDDEARCRVYKGVGHCTFKELKAVDPLCESDIDEVIGHVRETNAGYEKSQ